MTLLWFAVCGAVAAGITGQLMKDKAFGIAGDAAVGAAGALIGGYAFRSFEQIMTVNLAVAALCGTILLVLLRLYATHNNRHQPTVVQARTDNRKR